MEWNKKSITEKLHPINDAYMKKLRSDWFSCPQKEIGYKEFIPQAIEWFQSSRVNNIQGWNAFPLVDVTMGNTHYIESFILKYGWDGFQILKNEYAYYTLMGKHGVDVEDLEPNKPLLITLPHWSFCDLRPEWQDVLKICEQRNIDIHIDLAWIITARDIDLNLDHPCIKSFAMSMSKYSLQWSRVGLRWSRQKSMDSVTIFNNYYYETNTIVTSVGAYFINHLERDYCWNTYGDRHHDLCSSLGLLPTKIIHVVQDLETKKSLGIGLALGESTPNSI
jgi:hypothetical protein